MHDLRYNCPRCARPLDNVVEMDLSGHEQNTVKAERVHASGGAFVERRPLGIKIVGECMEHGLVKNIPMGVPTPI